MISSAMWNRYARVNFSETNKIKITRARRASAIWGILPYGVNTFRLQESDLSKHLSSCLYFVA